MRKSTMVFAVAGLVAASLAGPLPAQEKLARIKLDQDIVYGKGGEEDLVLDLAMPAEGNGPFPAVICIHGGAWKAGKRQDLARTIEVLASRGYVAATIGYRLAPAARFPAQIEDCKAAVRWLRANAATYRANPDRIGALGYSAGGHLACLLGTADKADGLEGAGGHAGTSSRVQAVVSFFGPTDFTNKDWTAETEENILVPFLGGTLTMQPMTYRQASAISYVTRDDPPFLFFHGTEDRLVPIRHSRILATRLQAVGVSAKVVALDGAGHGWTGERLLDTIKQTVAFFDENLKK